MLKIQEVSVFYHSRQILFGIDLDVESGEVVALIGPNGAGKSTLIRAVSGVIPIRSGNVHTNGDYFNTLSPIQRARYIATVPQAVMLPPAYTVWETVLFGRTPYLNFLGQFSEKDEERAHFALERADHDGETVSVAFARRDGWRLELDKIALGTFAKIDGHA